MNKKDLFFVVCAIDDWDDFGTWMEKYSKWVDGRFKGDAFDVIECRMTEFSDEPGVLRIGTTDDYFMYVNPAPKKKDFGLKCFINLRLYLNEAKKRNKFLGYKIIRDEEVQGWMDRVLKY